MTIRYRSTLFAALMTGGAMIPTVASAQDAATAATAPEAASETAPAEIIVTAQKRSERLQDVPVAVSVISGNAIAAQGGVNLENAQYLVPALNFRKSGVAINQSLFLRGVGTSTFSIAGEPSVSTVVDGVVYSRAGEAFSDLVDIERIEVLRGPQGTLFGKNASAGVVNVVSKQPTDRFEGMAEASYYTKDEYRARGAINLPLSDVLATRITGFYSKWDGNTYNETAGTKVNGYKRYGVRGQLQAKFSPDFTATLTADWRKSNDDCCAEIIGGPPLNADGTVNTTALALVQQAVPALRGDETRRVRQNLVNRAIQKSYGASLNLEGTVAGQTVTSITAYRKYDEREIRDGDFVGQATNTYNQLHDDGPQVGNTFTQELRLTSPGKQFIDYVAGVFYSRARTVRTFTRNDIVCAGGTAPPLTACGSALAAPSTFPAGTARFGSVFKNLAFFGQATVNISDQFRVIGGLRYTNDELSVFHSRQTTLAGPGIQPNFDQGVYNEYLRLVALGIAPTTAQTQAVALSNGVPFRTKTNNDNLSGKAGVQYDISRNSMAYATYARGYKGPAYNIFYNLTATGTNIIDPESADSYEVGLKNTLFGGQLVVNLAGFYAKYKNFQANNPDTVAGVLVTRFTNAGSISTRGVELDVLWRPVRDLNISGGAAYTDAKVDQFKVPVGGTTTGVIASGTTLGYAPKFKGSLGADYRWRTGGAVDFTFGLQSSYQSKQLSQFDANPVIRNATTIKAYGLVDLQASIVSADDRFRLTAQVKNVFDTSFAASITSGGPSGSYRYIIPREADRYFGLTGHVNF